MRIGLRYNLSVFSNIQWCIWLLRNRIKVICKTSAKDEIWQLSLVTNRCCSIIVMTSLVRWWWIHIQWNSAGVEHNGWFHGPINMRGVMLGYVESLWNERWFIMLIFVTCVHWMLMWNPQWVYIPISSSYSILTKFPVGPCRHNLW